MKFELEDLIKLENIIEEYYKSENFSLAIKYELLNLYYEKLREFKKITKK